MAERLELWCIPYTGIFKTASLHTDSVPDSFLWDFNPLTGPVEAVQPNIPIREGDRALAASGLGAAQGILSMRAVTVSQVLALALQEHTLVF